MHDDVVLADRTAASPAYRLEFHCPAAPDPHSTLLGHASDASALLVAAEEHARDRLARGEAGVLYIVNAATGQIVARRPVWPPGGPQPGIESDAWWGSHLDLGGAL